MPPEEWKEHIARINQSLETLNKEHGETAGEIAKLREHIVNLQVSSAGFRAEISGKFSAHDDVIKTNRKLLYGLLFEGFLNLLGIIGLVLALIRMMKP